MNASARLCKHGCSHAYIVCDAVCVCFCVFVSVYECCVYVREGGGEGIYEVCVSVSVRACVAHVSTNARAYVYPCPVSIVFVPLCSCRRAGMFLCQLA